MILAGDWPGGQQDCDLYDTARLRATGSLAIRLRGDALEVVTARDVSGDRLWNRRVVWKKSKPSEQSATVAAAALATTETARTGP